MVLFNLLYLQNESTIFDLHDMDRYIPRKIAASIENASPYYQVIVVTGPRQVGKTTLCKHLFSDFKYVNLEDLGIREIALADPKTFMDGLGKKAIIDEVQNFPEILSYIQVAVDSDPELKIILTGSSNFSLMQSVTQSLAGRAALFTLLPLAFDELGEYPTKTSTDEILFRGFYPALFDRKTPPRIFYGNYYSTYVERDIRKLMQLRNLDSFQTFMRLCAGRIGTEINLASLGVEVGVSAPTIREWMSLLHASYITFSLKPYYANINKRLTKTPKLYFYDTGLACWLLDIETPSQLTTHPLRGAIFENLAVIELMKERFNKGESDNLYFYRENSGREVDIVQTQADKLKVYEVKSSKTFNRNYFKNIDYLKAFLKDKISSGTIIYDGESFPPTIVNVRNI